MAKRGLYEKSDFERKRNVPGKAGDFRDPFRRDLARLVHSPAFRRLQGKTQLFPANENDFFRNRLSHSIEVSQIATGIAINLNATELKDDPVNEHLVHLASLAHDIGHPPFGHNGESVLDNLLRDTGGFEGNAQTLRIIARLEKKETSTFPFQSVVPEPIDEQHVDQRLGLNLTYRSLASIMKYDDEIPLTDEERKRRKFPRRPVKGYYETESQLVKEVKDHVAPGFKGKFKTLECTIMDLADDIAYSTYDLEDAFKAQFLSPLAMAAATANEKAEISEEINEKLYREYPNAPKIDNAEIDKVLKTAIFADLFDGEPRAPDQFYENSGALFRQSSVLCDDGYLRTEFTSKLVNLFISGIEFQRNTDFPALSVIRFNVATFKMVEILKKFAFKSLIMSPRLKITESRGPQIITTIFNSLLETEDGRRLLPHDWRKVYFGADGDPWHMRTICDFISSMTDRYCIEFYNRLTGADAPSIHKPY